MQGSSLTLTNLLAVSRFNNGTAISAIVQYSLFHLLSKMTMSKVHLQFGDMNEFSNFRSQLTEYGFETEFVNEKYLSLAQHYHLYNNEWLIHCEVEYGGLIDRIFFNDYLSYDGKNYRLLYYGSMMSVAEAQIDVLSNNYRIYDWVVSDLAEFHYSTKILDRIWYTQQSGLSIYYKHRDNKLPKLSNIDDLEGPENRIQREKLNSRFERYERWGNELQHWAKSTLEV